MKSSASIVLIVLLSTACVIALNEYNLSCFKPDFPYNNGLITSADEASYFAPARNFIQHGIWKDNTNGNSSYFTRTPAYGVLFILAHVLGEKHVFSVLKVFQLLFFAGSVLLFFKILLQVHVPRKTALFATAIYGIMPCFAGFVYYTLTESILPFFVLWSVHAILAMDGQRFISWNVIASNALLLLIRPQLMGFPALFFVAQLIQRKKSSVSLFIAFLPLFLWHIRTFSIEGSWLGMHPIYSPTNNTLFRPPHQEMGELFKSWEYRSDVFHTLIYQLSSDSSKQCVDKVLAEIPLKYRIDVAPRLKEFQRIRYVQQHFFANKKLRGLSPLERKFVVQCALTHRRLVAKFPFDYYVKVPLLSAKKLLVTSMMNLYVFQDPWRDYWIVKALKLISFIVLVASLCAVLFQLFVGRMELRVLALGLLFSLAYLIAVQRLNEERYILPYLSVMAIYLTVSLQQGFRWFKHR